MFNVNADLFRACALFQSTETTRYYLAGVHLEPHPTKGGVILAATDGHRALIAYDPDGHIDVSADNPYGYIVGLDKKTLASCELAKTFKGALPNRVTRKSL